jgi:hypothetical protein
MKQPTAESFLNDVSNHDITILKDDGLYRHIKIRSTYPNHSWNQWYDIITYPNGLVYTGDMGTYVFERTKDMFSFFRSGINKETKEISINSDYWAEKCKAQSVFGEGIRTFDTERFHENVKRYWEDYFEDNLESEEAIGVWEAIKESGLMSSDHEWELVTALNDFDPWEVETEFEFTDFWEDIYQSKTYYFIWCLYAIVFAIKLYDEKKEKQYGSTTD